MLNCILGFYCVLLPYIAWNISAQFIRKQLGFQKKRFFWIKNIFYFKKHSRSHKSNLSLSLSLSISLSLSLCPSKIQVIQHWALDFAYVNNYLAFKFSAWRSFTISFELKCHGLHRYYLGRFLPSSCKIYQGKLKLEPSNSLHIFEGSLNFPTIFTFKVLQLLYDCCNFSITMKMCCAMQ